MLETPVLDAWPPSFCGNCEKDTAYDGWGIGIGGVVELFCDECGREKASVAFKDIQDAALKKEILAVIAMGVEDEEDE